MEQIDYNLYDDDTFMRLIWPTHTHHGLECRVCRHHYDIQHRKLLNSETQPKLEFGCKHPKEYIVEKMISDPDIGVEYVDYCTNCKQELI